jgi:hypothetical protein
MTAGRVAFVTTNAPSGGRVIVRSGVPDKKLGTDDDVVVPESGRAALAEARP